LQTEGLFETIKCKGKPLETTKEITTMIKQNQIKWRTGWSKPVVCGSLLVLSVALTASVSHAASQLTVVAQCLNNPRGLAFAPNGSLYVAEAGLGAGDGKGGFAVGVGFTASITQINGVTSAHPIARRIVTGLASVGDTENGFPEALGPSGVSVQGAGGIYVTIGESALGVGAEEPDLPLAAQNQFGHLLKFTPSGQWKAVGDVGDFNYLWTKANQNQPWAPAGQFPDANPYGVLALAGRQFVADAGANTVNEVRPNGSVRLVAFVPNPLLPLPDGTLVPVSDSVPTCVAQGPDGFLYIGTLAFGANFGRFSPTAPPNWPALPPQSKIYRVDPKASEVFLTDEDVWASGFNPITACGFSNGALYVTEYVTQESGFATGDVVRVQVNPDGTAGNRTILGAGALNQPNGLAFDKNGSVYVSNFSISAGGGQVVRVNN
jgi:hypothetical protein